ncbi:MAG: ECF-type sigma factor [Planctomycetota bacterium]|jgi:RNA polymerase sigma factor (TIGR02999 family)
MMEGVDPSVYDDLRRLAERFMQRERRSHTLQPTALVHEAYLRLADHMTGLEQGHVTAIAARTMRRILVDHERKRRAKKRGGDTPQVTLPSIAADDDPPIDLLVLDEAMEELAELDERKCRIVELMFFAGLTVRESAECLGVSHRTVEDDWAVTRAWLRGRLG